MNTDGGALYIGAETDLKQFNGALSEAERRMKGFADTTTREGEKVNRTLNNITKESVKMTGDFKKGARQQVGLIADIENELTKLREKKRQAFSEEEIGKFNRKIQEAEMHLKEYNEAGKVAIDNGKEHTGIVDIMTGSIGKWALGLGGAAAALGILKKEFEETTVGINAFSIAQAAAKQVLQDVVGTGSVNISNVREAIAIQKELNNLRLVEYKEGLEVSKLNLEYQEKYSESLDATLSRSEKIKTINEALAAHNKAIDIEVKNTKEHIAATQRMFAIRPGNEKVIKELYDLNIELQNLEAQRYSTTKRLTRTLSNQLKEEAEEIKEFREKIREGLTKILDENLEMEEKTSNELKLAKLTGKDKELEALRQKYKEDLEAWEQNENIKKLLTEKYMIERNAIIDKYAKEQLDGLKKENEKFIQELLKIDPGKGYAILERAIVNASNVFGPGVNQLKRTNQDPKKNAKQADENIKDDLEKQLRLRKEIAAAAGELLATLGETLGMDERASSFIQSLTGAIQGALEGEYLGLAMSALNSIFTLLPNKTEEFNRQLERMNQLLDEQQRIIAKSERQGEIDQALQDRVDLLLKNKQILEAQIGDKNIKLLEKFGRSIEGYLVALPGITREMVDTWFDLNNQIEDARQQLTDFMTGDITQNNVADAIANGMLQGARTGIDAVAEYMNDELLNAAINVFKSEILGSSINEFTDQITQYLADKVLTGEEKQILDSTIKRISGSYKDLWDNLTGVFNLGEEAATEDALKGSIRGVSEQTASVVAGQMNAMRINQVDANGIIRQQLLQLSIIANNTAYCRHLEGIHELMKSDSMRATGII